MMGVKLLLVLITMYMLLLVILESHRTQAQNVVDGPPVDGTGGIIRVTQDGQAVARYPLGRADPHKHILCLWNTQQFWYGL